MSNVIPIRPERIRERAKAELECAREEGAKAWDRLRNRNRKLSPPDRNAIARNLQQEIERLGLSTRNLANRAGFAESKELYRLTLPRDADPRVRRLRADSWKYADLTKAIQHLTGENLHVLVDRMTRGTAVHPLFDENLSEIDELDNLLQLVANDLDCEFDLLSNYQAIAEVRNGYFSKTSWGRWPMYEFMPEVSTAEELKQELEYAAIPSNAYYSMHYGREWPFLEIDLAATLEWIPSLFVGYLLHWDGWVYDVTTEEEPHQVTNLRKQLIALYGNGDPPTKETQIDGFSAPATWLALYPNRELNSVVPVLLTGAEEVGVRCIALDHYQLLRLKDMQLLTDTVLTAFDAIQRAAAENLRDRLALSAGRLARHPYLIQMLEKQAHGASIRKALKQHWEGE